MCFLSTLNSGLREQGGIGDALSQLEYGDSKYWFRYTFDLSFYFIIIVLLLNLIFGIIIDALCEIRNHT